MILVTNSTMSTYPSSGDYIYLIDIDINSIISKTSTRRQCVVRVQRVVVPERKHITLKSHNLTCSEPHLILRKFEIFSTFSKIIKNGGTEYRNTRNYIYNFIKTFFIKNKCECTCHVVCKIEYGCFLFVLPFQNCHQCQLCENCSIFDKYFVNTNDDCKTEFEKYMLASALNNKNRANLSIQRIVHNTCVSNTNEIKCIMTQFYMCDLVCLKEENDDYVDDVDDQSDISIMNKLKTIGFSVV